MNLLRDTRGDAAAEYALIVAGLGFAVVASVTLLGGAVVQAGQIAATGPDGTRYVCTANCEYQFKDYCAAVAKVGTPDAGTFSPALPSSAKCDGETPIS